MVLVKLLVGTDKQVAELPPGGAGLGQHLRNRDLQMHLFKQEIRLQRHTPDTAPVALYRRF